MKMVRVKEGYKDTEIGVIPEEWKVVKLGDIGQFRKGKGIKKDEVLSGGLSCIRYGEIYTTYNHVVRNTNSYISKETAENSMMISKNEIVFAGSGETVEDIGKAVVYLNDEPCYVGGDTIIMKPAYIINSLFLSYYLATDKITKQKRKLGQGNSIVHIYVDGVKSIKAVIPSEAEQQCIAEILATTDEHIKKMDKIIKDYQLLKKGMMKKLLTEGIGHTEFKETEIGRIPEKWKTTTVKEVCKIATGKKNTQDKVDSGQYPFFVRSQKIERINSYSYDEEAVLTAGDGVGTGKVFHYINGKFEVHQRVYRMTEFKYYYNAYFFYLYFSNFFYNRVKKMSAKTSVDSVRLEMIAEMQIPIPPLQEQQYIASVLLELGNRIDLYQQEREDFNQLKKALMEQLLTGKIRVIQ